MIMNFFFCVICLLLLATPSRAQEFVPIQGEIPHDITGLVLPAFCARNSQIVQTLITIEPGDAVSVLTYPPDLVVVSTQVGKIEGANWLLFTYNQTAATPSGEGDRGGIRIQVPPSQLERVDACCSAQAQILAGFTHVKSLLASASASINAVLSVDANSTSDKQLDVVASTSASIAVDYEGGDCNIVSVGTSGSIGVKAKSVTKVDAQTSGTVRLELEEPPFSGSATTSGVMEISTPGGCDDVGTKSSGSCEVDEYVSVDVTVGSTFTRSGQEVCPIPEDMAPPPSGASTRSTVGNVLRAAGVFLAICFL